jgi:coenzyme F420-0:L-glutamate ligase/coenzyme F420-1:gamma-L-glutamate ligase
MTRAVALLMKDPAEAKTRLAPALGADARERMALLLFENALAFFVRFQSGQPLAVVTRSERIARLARAAGATVVSEEAHGGINGAARAAATWARTIGAQSLLVVHSDVPALADAELAAVIDAGRHASVVIAESTDGGSNALFLSPPDAIPFLFGAGSAARHEAAATERGLPCRRLRLPLLSRDVDTPDDLAHALAPARPEAGFGGFAVPGIPEITTGVDLAALIGDALDRAGQTLAAGDIIVVAQKIVSKAEGRMVPLAGYTPSADAIRIAAEIGKDPRKVEAILRESTGVIRLRNQPPDGLIITRHRQGWICANAAIDESNLGPDRDGMLLLLPEDPDASAARIRDGLEARFGGPLGVIVSDTFGRPWRHGLVNVAIGVAGVPAIVDWRTRTDAYGRGLKATQPAFADEVAAAAGLLMQKDAGQPVVVMRGLDWHYDPAARAADVLRPVEQELFL